MWPEARTLERIFRLETVRKLGPHCRSLQPPNIRSRGRGSEDAGCLSKPIHTLDVAYPLSSWDQCWLTMSQLSGINDSMNVLLGHAGNVISPQEWQRYRRDPECWSVVEFVPSINTNIDHIGFHFPLAALVVLTKTQNCKVLTFPPGRQNPQFSVGALEGNLPKFLL